jgi:hypothetical protein
MPVRSHWFSMDCAGKLAELASTPATTFRKLAFQYMAKKKTVSENPSATKATTKKTPAKDEKGFEESLWDPPTGCVVASNRLNTNTLS